MVSHSNLRSYSKKSIAVSLLAVNVILNFSKQEKQLRVFKSIESLFKIYLIAGLIQHIIFFISNAYSVPLTFIDRPYFNLNFKRVEWFILGSKQLRTIATLKTQRFNKTLKLLLRQHCLNPGIHHFWKNCVRKKIQIFRHFFRFVFTDNCLYQSCARAKFDDVTAKLITEVF